VAGAGQDIQINAADPLDGFSSSTNATLGMVNIGWTIGEEVLFD